MSVEAAVRVHNALTDIVELRLSDEENNQIRKAMLSEESGKYLNVEATEM